MFGNLMSRPMILKAQVTKSITITDFNKDKCQPAQYRLSPEWILHGSPRKWIRHNLRQSGPYRFQPHEYAIVVVHERIVLDEGVVGRFIPASGLIELGFGLTAGKLDPHYGERGEEIRFGLSNLTSEAQDYTRDSPLAHIEFFDLTAVVEEADVRRVLTEALTALRVKEGENLGWEV